MQKRQKRSRHELRCVCTHRPLLGIYGINEQGKGYIHVRVYKGGRVYGEVEHVGGITKLLCRECQRWSIFHHVTQTVDHNTHPPTVGLDQS